MKKLLLILALFNALFFAFLAPTTLMAQATTQGEIVLISLRHHGKVTALRAVDTMRAHGVTFACMENIAPAVQAYFLGENIINHDSISQQKGIRFDSIKKDPRYRTEIDSLVPGAFKMFEDQVSKPGGDTASRAFALTLGGELKKGWDSRHRMVVDGYDTTAHLCVSAVNLLYRQACEERDSVMKMSLINQTLIMFECFTKVREDAMATILTKKAHQGEVVGYPVGFGHEEGLMRRLATSGVKVTLIQFEKGVVSEDDHKMSKALNYSKLTEREAEDLRKYCFSHWTKK